MKLLVPVLLACAGCGYVGDPMPPLLNIPQPPADVTLSQRGDQLVVEFTAPTLTTEGVEIKKAPRYEIRVGDTELTAAALDTRIRASTPAAPLIGRAITARARAISANGRDAGWSTSPLLTVLPPVAAPAAVVAANDAQGVRVTWQSGAPAFRVFRRAPAEEKLTFLADAKSPEFIDRSTEYGRVYEYQVIAVTGAAESDPSAIVRATTKDDFPPSVPAGLTAAAGIDSIELVWTPSPESDVAGYRVHRAEGDGPFARVGDIQPSPTFTDRTIAAGKTYRYAVSSIDRTGNESARGEAVEVTLP